VGRLLVIDGASCSGKSTVVRRLLALPEHDLVLAKRYTTRAPRAGDEVEDNYYFVDAETYQEMVAADAFLEHKDYLFGMSYGLPRQETADLLARHAWVLALINLGRFAVVKAYLPDAFGVLLTVPVPTIERRLRARGISTEAQIAERLENAARSFGYAPDYDLVLDNDDGRLEAVLARVQALLDG